MIHIFISPFDYITCFNPFRETRQPLFSTPRFLEHHFLNKLRTYESARPSSLCPWLKLAKWSNLPKSQPPNDRQIFREIRTAPMATLKRPMRWQLTHLNKDEVRARKRNFDGDITPFLLHGTIQPSIRPVYSSQRHWSFPISPMIEIPRLRPPRRSLRNWGIALA